MSTPASQTLRNFMGDHQSSKMFQAIGLSRNMLDGAMTSGSATLHSATGGFAAGDVGKIAIVQGAGAAGAALVTTVSALVDSTHVTLAATAGTTVTGKSVDIGVDETAGLLSALIPLGGTGEGVQRLIPKGRYLVTPGGLLIPNFQSSRLQGHGARFGTVITSADPNSPDPVFTFGDGTWEAHSSEASDFAVSCNHAPDGVGIYFNRINIQGFRNIIVQDIGPGGTGWLSNPSPTLFGEMIFDRCSAYGQDGDFPAGSTGIKFLASSNVTFQSCNVEVVETGIDFTGLSQLKFTFIGGRLERIGAYGFILRNCQPFLDCELNVGAIWLDNDVVNGYINLSNTSRLWTVGAVVDNGFGNRIRKSSSAPFNGTKASYAAGLSFDGDEWLSVGGLHDDPTFLQGVADWTATNGTVTCGRVVMPGAKRGRSLHVTASSANAYAERTFTAEANKDYLVQVGLLVQASDTYRIVVANSGGTVWDSGNLTYTLAAADFQSFKIIRKSIPVTSDTDFIVRIYAVNSGQVTVCSLLLISKSQIQMGGDYGTTGSGLTTSGSGPDFMLIQDTSLGTVYSSKVVDSKNRGFARAVVNVPAGVTAYMGIGGDGNAPEAGPMVPLRAGVTAEYTIPLASYPDASTIQFYSFGGGGSIEIQELGLYEIDDLIHAPYVIERPYTGLRNALALTDGRLWLNQNFNANWQSAASAGNGFKRCLYASNIFWDEDSGVWQVPNNGGGDWSALVMLNGGDIAFACEAGLTLPTTRSDAQFNAAVRFRILAASGKFILTPPGLSETHHIVIGGATPEGFESAPVGSICQAKGGSTGTCFYVKESGSGATGWIPISSIFTIPSTGIARTDYSIGIQKTPSTWTLEVAGYIQTDNSIVANGLTASRPVVTDGSKILISSKIELNNGNHVTNTLGVTNGGTGGNTVSAAQSSLNVYDKTVTYTKTEVDALIAAAIGGHVHHYTYAVGDHSHGGVTTGASNTSPGGAASGSGDTGGGF